MLDIDMSIKSLISTPSTGEQALAIFPLQGREAAMASVIYSNAQLYEPIKPPDYIIQEESPRWERTITMQQQDFRSRK